MSQAAAANTIHHTQPEEVHHEPVHVEAPLKNDFRSQEFVGKFAKWIDNKDLDEQYGKTETAFLDKAMNV